MYGVCGTAHPVPCYRQANAGCFTPLQVTAEDDEEEPEKRDAWRTLYRDVFGLPQPQVGRFAGANVRLGAPPSGLGPAPGPAAQAHVAAQAGERALRFDTPSALAVYP